MLSIFTADVLRLAIGGVKTKLRCPSFLLESVGLRTPLPIICVVHVLLQRGYT